MKKNICLNPVITIIIIFFSCHHKNQNQNREKEEVDINTLCEHNFKDAVGQYKFLKANLPKGRFPQTYEDGKLKTSGSG